MQSLEACLMTDLRVPYFMMLTIIHTFQQACDVLSTVTNMLFSGDESISAHFTRDSIYAIARICHANSVLSHACFVSKWLNASSKFFHYLIGPSF